MKTVANSIIAFLLILTPISGFSQEDSINSSKLVIGVAVGVGMPMGDFGKSDTVSGNSNKTNGWATVGFHFNVKTGYRFTNNIGVMIQVGGNVNGFNSQGYLTQYKSEGLSTFTSTSHYIGSYLAGPFLYLPINQKFAFGAHLLFGLMTAASSKDSGSGGESKYSYKYTTTTNSASAFGYNIGAGLIMKLTDQVGLTVGVDYLGGSPALTCETVTDTQANGSTVTSTNTTLTHKTMDTTLMCMTVGLIINL